MESKLVLHTKTRHINVYAHPENVTHLTKEKMGTLNLQGGMSAYVKQFIDGHNQDESAHPYIQENLSALEGTVTEHIDDTNNPHSVTKAQVGLGNVDNTSDLNKPISTATQAALDGKQATISDLETIRSGAALGATSVQPDDLATVATTGDYNDLTNKPTIGNATLTIQKNGTSAGTFTANATSNKTINITVPTTAADVDALPDTTKYGASLEMSVNSSTFVVTTALKDQDGNTLGTAQTIDLPLESVVVSGSYDATNKKVVLTLQNGSTIEFSVADLVAGLQSEITSTNKLSADLVDDTSTTHKFVTASDKSTWNGKQDAISDLATIRSGAAAGATALQPSVAASTYATKEEIAEQYTESNLVPEAPVSFTETQLADFYTVVGSPTIEDGIVTRITSSNRVNTNSSLPEDPNSIELFLKIRSPYRTYLPIFSFLGSGGSSIQLNATNSGTVLVFRKTSSAVICDTPDLSDFPDNKWPINSWFYCRLLEEKVTGGWKYTLSVSPDNINWSSSTSETQSVRVFTANGISLLYTNTGTAGGDPKMDLNNTYIKVNGNYFVPPLSSTIVSVSAMTGATSSVAGASGLVPAPAAGDETKFLRGDGTWVGSTSAAVWGSLTGTLSDQTDLQTAINSVKRNIGELVQSHIPLTDAGLHLLDGSLINGTGSYAAFVTYIAGLVSDYPGLFETEANWQTSVTNYDVCGKFVYDSVNNTVRLPKLLGVSRYLIKSEVNGTEWRRIYSDGWCEQGGYLGDTTFSTKTISLPVPYNDTNFTILTSVKNSSGAHNFRFTKDSSSSITFNRAGDGNCTGHWMTLGYTDISSYKVEPLYQYIVIANSTKTEIEVDIDEIATDLNGKADTDLANITGDGKQAIINSLMPDYENVISVDSVAHGTYTQVVKDSFVVTWGPDPYTENYYVYVSPDNGTTKYIVGRRYDDENAQTEEVSFSFFVPKGWYFMNDAENGYYARIYPLKGAQ